MISILIPEGVPPEKSPVEPWAAAPREPVFYSDDPREWRFIEAMWLQEPVTFRYWGGRSPGALRRIVPRRVFRVGALRPLYFTGWCPWRREERTFRADRAEVQSKERQKGNEFHTIK